jgi:plasmid stabilization system protein ParE
MSRLLRTSDYFIADFDHQFRWFLERASEAVARRYLEAVWETLQDLSAHPGLGRRRSFRHPELAIVHSFRVHHPFETHLIFYRFSDAELTIERLMSGRRDLARRLREPPSADSD